MELSAERDLAFLKKMTDLPKLPFDKKVETVMRALRSRDGSLVVKKIAASLMGPGKLTMDEAVNLRVFDGDISPAEASRFIGRRKMRKFHAVCNDVRWYAASMDKGLYYTIGKGAGLRLPTTRAMFGGVRRPGFPRYLSSAEEFSQFLSENERWPIFLKPVEGRMSVGALKAMGAADGKLDLFGIGETPIVAVAAYMTGMCDQGYFIQDCLAPAPFAAEAFGEMVPSVRFVVLFSTSEPKIESAVLKIPSGKQVADNYWRGNMLGALSLDSGTVTRVVSGIGPDLIQHEQHPATGKRLVGLSIPGWADVCRTVLEGAMVFPGVRTQSWDVALTPAGAVLLEVNYGGDLNLHQLAHRCGILTPGFVEHLRRCGYKGKLS